MKYIIFFLPLLSVPIDGFVQEKPEKAMVYNLTQDTTLKADYYNVAISIAEYIRYERINKKSTMAHIVSLDTLSAKLLSKLYALGFSQPIEKSSITEADNSNEYYRYQSGKNFFQATYSFSVSNIDSIDYLFRNIDREIVSGMRISPELRENTIEKVKGMFIAKGMESVEQYATEMAARLGQKIVKSKYNVVFYDGGYNNNYIDFNKKFQIDFRDILYKLTISYTYYLAEK